MDLFNSAGVGLRAAAVPRVDRVADTESRFSGFRPGGLWLLAPAPDALRRHARLGVAVLVQNVVGPVLSYGRNLPGVVAAAAAEVGLDGVALAEAVVRGDSVVRGERRLDEGRRHGRLGVAVVVRDLRVVLLYSKTCIDAGERTSYVPSSFTAAIFPG